MIKIISNNSNIDDDNNISHGNPILSLVAMKIPSNTAPASAAAARSAPPAARGRSASAASGAARGGCAGCCRLRKRCLGPENAKVFGRSMGNLWKIYGKSKICRKPVENLWKINGTYMGKSVEKNCEKSMENRWKNRWIQGTSMVNNE